MSEFENTEAMELSIEELEQVRGGSILAAVALGSACVCLAVEGIKLGRKLYRDITSD